MRERKGRIVSLLMIVTLVLGVLQPMGKIKVKAESGTMNLKFEYNYNTLEAKVVGALSDIYSLELSPTKTYGGDTFTITEIGANALANQTKLMSVTLPDTIKKIGDRAFYGCSGLRSIEISSSVTELGDSVFEKCSLIDNVIIPSSVTKMGSYTFRDCWLGTKNIKIDANIKTLGDGTFEGCQTLSSVELSDSIKKIGSATFQNCDRLKTIKLPKNLEELDTTRMFNGCDTLIKIENFPQDIKVIGDNTFYGCREIETVGINFDNITKIGTDAFNQCVKLEDTKQVVFEKNISFGMGAFRESNLQSITVKEDIETIPESLFAGCVDLGTVNITGYNTIGASAFSNTAIKKFDLSGIKNIEKSTFSNCVNLTNVVGLSSAENIGSSAFHGCSGLTNIDLSNVENISGSAFSGCSGLTNVTFSNKLKEIGVQAFGFCDNWIDIYIPNSVTTIGANAFRVSADAGTVMTNLYSDNLQAINYDWVASNRNVTKNAVVDYDKVPKVIQASRTYRKANPNDISFAVDLGRGSKAATDIAGVMINYIELDESSYELSGNTLIIKKEVLTDLDKGFYDVGVTFNDTDGTSITGLLSILVVESSSSDNNNGDNSKPPVALETLSYQFYKDYQRDIVVPIQMNSANTLEELYLGTDLIDKDKYSFTNDTIILDKNYLDTVSAGLYRLIPVFDGDKKINNLLLEIYDKYDDRLLPYLLPSHISFKNQDLRLKVELGEGKTKAKDIKLLVIDDMYITPNGEIHQKNPLIYGRTASGSAIIKSRIQTYFSLGKNLVEVEVKSPKAYYLDGDELVLTANLIKKLGFVADSVHTVGCIFDNSEETASLNRVTLVIPNQQNDSDNSGDQNNGNNSNQGNNSNGDSNNSNNQNNGNNNNQGSNSNGSSSNSGNQTSGDGTNQGINANESNNSSQQHENGVLIAETITLKDIIYTGKSDVIIPLTKVNEIVAHIKLNGKELKKEEYQIVGNQLVLFRSTLNQLKDGTNGITIQTKSDIPRTYIAFIQFDFSKQESKIPFMTTYKLLLKGSKFPVYLSNQKEVKKITWNTSNSKIVSVSKKGVLTARKKGKATVTCVITNKKGDLYKFQIKVTVKDGKKKSFYTKVKKKPYDSNFPVFIMDKLVYKGKTVHIKVSNLSKDSKISYKSSNPSVATVDKKGNIKGRKKGKATIIVTLKQNKETYIYQLQCQCK